MDAKQKIAAELKQLEKDYRRYRKADVMVALKSSVLDRLWDIFGTSVIKPEAAPFVTGRMFEAFAPYRDALYTLKRYEELEGKLADLAIRADEAAS